MIEHDGAAIPIEPTVFDPDGTEWVEQAWDQDVEIHGVIQSSAWIVPTGWTATDGEGPVPVTADGVEYTHGTRVRLTTTATSGYHLITNRVTFADGTVLDRSRYLRVGQA